MNKNIEKKFNSVCITQVSATILKLLNLKKEEPMADFIPEVIDAADTKFGTQNQEQKCDRIFMYNPDAIAEWVFDKYEKFTSYAKEASDLKLNMLSVIPPVTPVCFGSMYSGLQPSQHGIQKYEKPVLKCHTVFDSLIAAGKKVAIVSTEGDSISLIFLNRNMDYFIYKTVDECNQKAKQLIEDKNDLYDVIVLYNTNYDYWMHRVSPTGFAARKALKENCETFCNLKKLISENWKNHKTALAFAPDHGCHRMAGILGTHGINEVCDMNIYHLWSFI